MGSRLIGDWDKLENALRNAGNKIDEAATKAAGQAGFLLVKRIKEGIKSQAPAGQKFEPIGALTAGKKGSTKALFEKGGNGGLISTITWKRVRGGVWIGTNYRSKKGVNIARVHEKGATIEVTDAMRKGFVAVIGRRIKKTTKYIRIPARPFISPIMNDKKTIQEAKILYCKAIKEVFRK